MEKLGETGMGRRRWLGGALGLAGGAALGGWHGGAVAGAGAVEGAVEAPVPGLGRTGGARLRLGLAAYSFRQHFGWMRGERREAEAPEMDMMGFVDYCAERGLDGAEITSYFLAGEAAEEELLALRRHCFLRGVSVSGTAIGNDFTRADEGEQRAEIDAAKRWIDKAAVLGAPHLRVFAGPGRGLGLEEAKDKSVVALRECADYAAERGIFLGLENHGGIVAEADDLLDIVAGVDSEWLGINLDTGNFKTEDPYGDLERCAPWAVNVQVKAVVQDAGGRREQADYGRLADILRGASYQGWVVLEYEEEDPHGKIPGELARLREAITGADGG